MKRPNRHMLFGGLLSALWLSILFHYASADEAAGNKGPILQLDAQQLNSRLSERDQKPLADGDPVVMWPGGVGDGQVDFLGDSKAACPTFKRIGDHAVVRFDGVDDAMRYVSSWDSLKQCTLWLVVAPHENPGEFEGLLSTNAAGERDYVSGINVDLGPGPSRKFDFLNVEGKGFSGAQDLLDLEYPFATLHVIQVIVDSEAQRVSVFVDGRLAGNRPMQSDSISVQEWTLGARYYTNGPGTQQIRGPFRGDIAEVVVYDRVMSDAESITLHDALKSKYADLAAALPASIPQDVAWDPLTPFGNPPSVQMLVPGFQVERIPVQLTNVNNVRYRPDGALVTLGYNGDIQILRDTDGDGLEDSATMFYKNTGSLRGPIGFEWTRPNDPRGPGCFVASKGKISFFADRDGDDVADGEQIVAQGWEEIPQNVDAVGLAIDSEGWVYFGLGTANYANAYLVDDKGQSKYDLKSDRGTIQRVSPDFTQRETVCTGIRFPIGLAFHASGDLFCTDQEGATWLPNGNPFDELLHIRSGKHYGFPPRHPKHNPSVIDEPSVFDYGPQHQSTCGMFFNASAEDSYHVGPAYWSGDAIVCGESRGKLWRTSLMKTEQGYVAQNQLIACLQMLTVDACPTPDGAMVVACHSGPPDWGTGPAGIGELFKIRSIQHAESIARPVSAWFSSLGEIIVALDAPFDVGLLKSWDKTVDVFAGPNVRAGDRYENLIPPYAVVKAQSVMPRRRVPVTSLGISPDRRNLIVRIPPQATHESYAVRLPTSFSSLGRGLEQRPEMEVDVTPSGVLAEWIARDDPELSWSGTLPHWNLDVSRAFTQGSFDHDRLWELLKQPGTLQLRTILDASDVLRPKVQIGAAIDYEWPVEQVTVSLLGPVEKYDIIGLQGKPPSVHAEGNNSLHPPIQVMLEALEGRGPLVEINATYRLVGSATATPGISMSTQEDPEQRAIPLRRFRIPGFEQNDAPRLEGDLAMPNELEGGNWGRGRRIFLGATAKCSACHREPGFGSTLIGPDLSNLIHRDYASVLRDITHPSYAINPEFIGQKIRMNDGTVLTGVLREQGGELLLGDAEGKTQSLEREAIAEMSPSATSTMPAGLLDSLSEQERKDLLTYLLRPAPSMPLERPNPAPPMRTAAEVAEVLAGSTVSSEPYRPMKIVLVAGPKDHGPNEHDYPAWLIQWGQLLAAAEQVTVEAAWEFPDANQLEGADALIFFQKGSWNTERARAMDAFFQRGGGALYLHWAVNGDDEVQGFADRIGLASWGGRIHYRHGPLTMKVHNTDHPILRNINDFELLDESYWLLTGREKEITVLATSEEEGMPRPQLWTYERHAGRVFVSIPGHYSWTFDDPIFRTILLRGIAWISKEPIDRFNELVPLGARMSK